jgi:pyrimidine operon attenuation protein / uracil phosphoribosyltransferase
VPAETHPTTEPPHSAQTLLDAEALQRVLERIARELLEKHPDPSSFSLIGIPSRGVELAARLAKVILDASGKSPFCGAIDVSMHRDDIGVRSSVLAVQPTRIPRLLSSGTIVLVDDVLQSGRTCRAALDALSSFGRPHRIEYAVLIDRGMRELPIAAGYVGKTVEATKEERVFVRLKPLDAQEGVWLERVAPSRR